MDELGSDGLAVETNVDGIYLCDPRYDPLWEKADRRGTTIFVHPHLTVRLAEVGSGTKIVKLVTLRDVRLASTLHRGKLKAYLIGQ